MKEKIDYLLYGLSYVVRTRILGRRISAIGGLVINDRCNLNCGQCKVADTNGSDLPYSDAELLSDLQNCVDLAVDQVTIYPLFTFPYSQVGRFRRIKKVKTPNLLKRRSLLAGDCEVQAGGLYT